MKESGTNEKEGAAAFTAALQQTRGCLNVFIHKILHSLFFSDAKTHTAHSCCEEPAPMTLFYLDSLAHLDHSTGTVNKIGS